MNNYWLLPETIDRLGSEFCYVMAHASSSSESDNSDDESSSDSDDDSHYIGFNTYESDDENEEDGIQMRNPRFNRTRIDWDQYAEQLLRENEFTNVYRMPYHAFCELVTILERHIQIDTTMSQVSSKGEAVIGVPIITHCVLRYLAGGSVHDIRTCGKK